MIDIELMQGDCLELMEDIKENCIDMILTDIPYNAVNRESNGLRNLDKKQADVATFALSAFLNEIYRVSRGYCVVFCGKEQFSQIYSFFSGKNGTTRPIIWQKSNPSPMNGQHVYLSGVEMAVWFKKRGHKSFNAHCKNTVFKYPNGRSRSYPTEKNIKLFEELILDCSNERETILDPCMGSGTTGVACKNLNRNFIGIELDETYFNIAKERIESA